MSLVRFRFWAFFIWILKRFQLCTELKPFLVGGAFFYWKGKQAYCLVCSSYKKQVSGYFSPDGCPNLHALDLGKLEICQKILMAMLLLLCILFQFQHVFIKIRHKQPILNNTIFFKFSFSFCLGNLSSDFACILKNLSIISHQE